MTDAAEKRCPAPAGQGPTSASSQRVDGPRLAQEGPTATSSAIGPARAVQRGKQRQAEAGQEGPRRASRDDSAGDEGGSLRWDRLGAEERRAWSAQIAASEAHEQGLPALASPAQHRAVAAVLARGCTTGPADAAAGGPS